MHGSLTLCWGWPVCNCCFRDCSTCRKWLKWRHGSTTRWHWSPAVIMARMRMPPIDCLPKTRWLLFPLLQYVCLKLVTRLNMLTSPPPPPLFFSFFLFSFVAKGFCLMSICCDHIIIDKHPEEVVACVGIWYSSFCWHLTLSFSSVEIGCLGRHRTGRQAGSWGW